MASSTTRLVQTISTLLELARCPCWDATSCFPRCVLFVEQTESQQLVTKDEN